MPSPVCPSGVHTEGGFGFTFRGDFIPSFGVKINCKTQSRTCSFSTEICTAKCFYRATLILGEVFDAFCCKTFWENFNLFQHEGMGMSNGMKAINAAVCEGGLWLSSPNLPHCLWPGFLLLSEAGTASAEPRCTRTGSKGTPWIFWDCRGFFC